ncbi:MAG: hypothetical protein GF411_20515 [Candidatus Lokiarchaeota archaeon]|nr:hypothetical protein [Candidatus Lokiarchaeota archaeon]
MKMKEFCNQIESSKDMSGVGMELGENDKLKSVIVKSEFTGLDVKLPVEAIEKSDWSTISDIIAGKREPAVLQHMSRVVGYFSKIENWNSSKIGELHDRQKGDYQLKD